VTSYASPALAAPDGGGPPARRAGPHRACVVGDDEHFIGFEPMICRDDGRAVAKAQRWSMATTWNFGAASGF